MTKFFYVMTAFWVNGSAEITVASYEECWALSDRLWQEEETWRPANAGALERTTCEKTDRLSATPYPKIRPQQ